MYILYILYFNNIYICNIAIQYINISYFYIYNYTNIDSLDM